MACPDHKCFAQRVRFSAKLDEEFKSSYEKDKRKNANGSTMQKAAIEDAYDKLRARWNDKLKPGRIRYGECPKNDSEKCYCAYEDGKKATLTHSEPFDDSQTADVLNHAGGTATGEVVTITATLMVDYLTLHGECQDDLGVKQTPKIPPDFPPG